VKPIFTLYSRFRQFLLPILILSTIIVIQTPVPDINASKTNGELKNPDKFIWETLGIPSTLDSLDPAINYETTGSTIIELIYETLVGYKGNSVDEIEGRLATDWTISPNGRVYTFNLRKNVKFHDGVSFNAYIMKYSIDRTILINDRWGPSWMIAQVIKGGSTYLQYYNPNYTEAQAYLDAGGVVVIDDYTLQINLDSAYSPFINSLAFDVACAVSPKAVINNRPSEYSQFIGDKVYGVKVPFLNRQFLHANRLKFKLPSSGEYIELKCELPTDLKLALDYIRRS